MAAAYMIILSVFGKFCAVFVTIPDPVLGGVYLVMFGMETTNYYGQLGLYNAGFFAIIYFILASGTTLYHAKFSTQSIQTKINMVT